MREQRIVEEIYGEIKRLSKEKPKELYYSLDSYTDDYDGDSLVAVAMRWEKGTGSLLSETFPNTDQVIKTLEKLDDGEERSQEIYSSVIQRAKEALKEIENYDNDRRRL